MEWGEGEGGRSMLQGTLKVGAEEGATEKSKRHLILLGTKALVCVLGAGEGLGLNWKVGCVSLLSQQLRALTLHTNHITPTTRLGK